MGSSCIGDIEFIILNLFSIHRSAICLSKNKIQVKLITIVIPYSSVSLYRIEIPYSIPINAK